MLNTDSPLEGRVRDTSSLRHRLVWFLEILAIYAFMTTNLSVQYYLRKLHTPGALPLSTHFLYNGPTGLAWALVTPLIVWFARRYPFEAGKRARALRGHVGGVLVVAPLQVFADAGLTRLAETAFGVGMGDPAQYMTHLLDAVAAGFFDAPQMYAVTVAIYYTVAYYRKFREREVRASQLETQLVQAQLQALKTQLQPHFLFNTLNAVSTLMHRDIDAAERMVVRLADLLRLSLETTGVQEVSLKQELEILDRYVEIEKVRFSDRLAVEFDVDPATLDAAVPNLRLQPLVENAVRHGIAPRSAPGVIRVRSRAVDGTIELRVADDGVGLGARSPASLREGVGLSNTRARLAQLYGASARFEIVAPRDGGFEVRLTLPFRLVTGGADAGGLHSAEVAT
jgi:two-component system, LytTR family, sensor kinase